MTKTVSLGEICVKIISGGTPSTERPEFWGGSIPWITSADIKDHYTATARKFLTEKANADVLPAGNILVVTRVGLGKLVVNQQPLAFSQDLQGLVLKPNVDRNYLVYVLSQRVKRFKEISRGATIKGVTRDDLVKIKLPLPPLPRQRQIAAILDRADALRQKDRRLLEYYDQLAQSTFMDLFGDPVQNEKEWPTESIRSLSNFITDGPFGSNLKTEHYRSNGVRVIRLNNIGVGEFLDTDKAYVSEEHHRKVLKKNTCLPGDVLIGTLGEPNLRACILPDYVPVAINKADCVLCKPNYKKITARYLTAVLNNPGTLSLASRSMRGQTRVRISMGQVAMLKIAVPPLTLQQHFADVIDRIEKQKAIAKKQIIASEALFHRLIQDSFGV